MSEREKRQATSVADEALRLEVRALRAELKEAVRLSENKFFKRPIQTIALGIVLGSIAVGMLVCFPAMVIYGVVVQAPADQREFERQLDQSKQNSRLEELTREIEQIGR